MRPSDRKAHRRHAKGFREVHRDRTSAGSEKGKSTGIGPSRVQKGEGVAASISRIGGARAIACAAIAVGLLLLLVLPVSQSFASEHTEVTGEYGKEGPKSSGLGVGCHLGYNGSTGHLYLAADGKIYGLADQLWLGNPARRQIPRSAPESAPNAANPTSKSKARAPATSTASSPEAAAKSMAGTRAATPSATPWPVSVPGGGRNLWRRRRPGRWTMGRRLQPAENLQIFRSRDRGLGQSTSASVSASSPSITSPATFTPPPYGGGQLVEFTASSGYTEKINFPAPGGEPGLAVNDAEHKLYVGNGSSDRQGL